MGKRKWTDEQSLAIKTRDRTLLVSAAAGSGKTATLTERIIRSLLDKESPLSISNMLIVTFTNAAVGELRERITDALREALAEDPNNDRLRQELLMLPSARICTIDSFCADIVRSNSDRVGISPTFRIADTAEAELLADSILDSLINRIYDKNDQPISAEDLERLSDCLTDSRTQDELSTVLRALYTMTSTSEDGVDILMKHADRYDPDSFTGVNNTEYGKYIDGIKNKMCNHYKRQTISLIDEVRSHPELKIAGCLAVLENDLSFFERLFNASGYTEAREIAVSHTILPSKSVSGGADILPPITEMRKQMKADVGKNIERFYSFPEASWQECYSGLHKLLTNLYKLLKKFDELFRAEKIKRNMCEYSDIERYAYECLYEKGERTDIALSFANTFDAVYIDEYQDVNSLQNRIFEAVSSDTNRFMVGDIKQSIYSFRSANPSIFADMKREFPAMSDTYSASASIFMSNNFRCDEGVVDFVNEIFDKVFYMMKDSIGYEENDKLKFSKIYDSDPPKYLYPQLCIVDKRMQKEMKDAADEEDEESSFKLEPYVVARKIKELINSESRLNNGNQISPSDIAIILRNASGKDKQFAAALESEGIPCALSDEKSFFLNSDILLALCLLNAIDNPRKDIYLTGLMRSPLYSFSADKLVKIQLMDKGTVYDSLLAYADEHPEDNAVRSFIDELNYYRHISEGLTVDKLLIRLFHRTGLMSLAAADGGRKNLMRLYEHARSFEAGSFKGLYNFISYINNIIDKKNAFDTREAPTETDAVRIITVHSSKGLEYPIVFLCDAGASMKNENEKARIIYDENFGIGMYLRTDSGLALVTNPTKPILADYKNRLSFEEEMRVLYVALTRARERLYVVGTPSKYLDKYTEMIDINKEYLSEYSLYNLNSFLDVITAVSSAPIKEINGFIESDLNIGDLLNLADADESEEKPLYIDEELLAKLKERFEYKYPMEHMTKLPEKISVSHLYPDILDGADEHTAELTDTHEDETHIAELRFAKTGVLPSFVSGEKSDESAKRGIATHLVLQFADFSDFTEDKVKGELNRLLKEKFISEKDAERVRVNELILFARSELYGDIRRAKRLEREFRFNTLLDASDFTKEEEKKKLYKDEKILVQGVIDCIIEDSEGNLRLIDYKTDRLTREELANPTLAEKKLRDRHTLQLSYYAKAIEKIFGKRPVSTEIYSLQLGRTIRLEV